MGVVVKKFPNHSDFSKQITTCQLNTAYIVLCSTEPFRELLTAEIRSYIYTKHYQPRSLAESAADFSRFHR
nr:hypothetical protein [uncultured Prevotella sp.]